MLKLWLWYSCMKQYATAWEWNIWWKIWLFTEHIIKFWRNLLEEKKNWALIRNNSQQRDAVIYFWIKILADISIRSKWEKTSKNRKGQKKSKGFWKSKNKVLLWNRKADQMFSKLHEIIASLTRAKKSKKMCTSKI